MKKFPLAFALMWLLSATAFAQTGGGYRVDNFDFKDGVRIASPVEVPTLKVTESKTRLTAKTAKNSAVKAGNSKLAYTPVAMSPNKSLDGFTTGDARID